MQIQWYMEEIRNLQIEIAESQQAKCTTPCCTSDVVSEEKSTDETVDEENQVVQKMKEFEQSVKDKFKET